MGQQWDNTPKNGFMGQQMGQHLEQQSIKNKIGFKKKTFVIQVIFYFELVCHNLNKIKRIYIVKNTII